MAGVLIIRGAVGGVGEGKRSIRKPLLRESLETIIDDRRIPDVSIEQRAVEESLFVVRLAQKLRYLTYSEILEGIFESSASFSCLTSRTRYIKYRKRDVAELPEITAC